MTVVYTKLNLCTIVIHNFSLIKHLYILVFIGNRVEFNTSKFRSRTYPVTIANVRFSMILDGQK